MISEIKKRLKENKTIVEIYMKLYGRKKEQRRVQVAKETLQNEGFAYMQRVEQALEKTNARFFVNFGTLMGILRSGKFISWDNDLDYGIYIDDSFSWIDLEKTMAGIGMKLARQFGHNGIVTEQTYKTDKLTVDFFAHVEDENNSYEYVYFWKKDYDYKSPNDTHVCRLKMYKFSGTEKREIKDAGIIFTAPNEAEKYLASIYTENWRIPDPNWVSSKGPAWNELPDTIGHAEYF